MTGVKVVPFAKSRDRYAELLDSVVADREEVMIVRPGREPVVLVTLTDYEALQDLARLAIS